MTAITNVDL